MGDVKEIKEASATLYKALVDFVKKRGAMLAIVGSITGVGSWQISDLWSHVHNIEKLPEKFEQLDSIIVVVDGMHDVYISDSVNADAYLSQMKSFIDTLPYLMRHAKLMESQFGSVKMKQSEVLETQSWLKRKFTDIDDKVYELEKKTRNSHRSISTGPM